MTPAQLPNLAEASPVIRVAIVRGPETTVLAESLEALLAKAKGAFPHRSVPLVTPTDPDRFDFFRVLEMGASDFLLPPLQRSGCGSSEPLQTIQPENRSQSEGNLSGLSSVFGFNTNQ
jgi:hypothetical protein